MKRLRRMFRVRASVLLVLLLLSPIALSSGSLSQLKHRLANGPDFRVRVQAALELGKSKHRSVRTALERALKDKSSAVRASAAAALQVHGDIRALPALRGLAAADPSESVKRQARAAIDSLSSSGVGAAYVVQIGRVRAAKGVRTQVLNKTVRRVARQSLRRLPGVVMKSVAEGSSDEALPTLQFDGTVERVSERKHGDVFAVSARVEFVISLMPGRVIKGRIAGAATVHGEASVSKRGPKLRRLRQEAVEAATESALVNAAKALRAASRS